MYLLTAIVGFGGGGIWVELVSLYLSDNPDSYDGVYTAAATVYLTLIGTASFQLLLIADDTNKVVTSFLGMVSSAAFACAILLSIFFDPPVSNRAFYFSNFSRNIFYLALDRYQRR